MERVSTLRKKASAIKVICIVALFLALTIILVLQFVLTAEALFYTLCISGLLGFVGIIIGMYMVGNADGKLEEAKKYYESDTN